MDKLVRFTWVPVAVALFYMGYTFFERRTSWSPRPAAAYRGYPGVDGTAGVKILQFYASPGALTEGEKASVCYGVVNAKTVRLDPPVESLGPSANRCISVGPDRDTRYTLTAEGSDSRVVSESFVIQVKADPSTLPRILFFTNSKKQVDRFGHAAWTLCYQAENAEEISVDPPVMPLGHAFRGCFAVAPRATTTYTLKAVGRKARKVERQVTVNVGAGRAPGAA